MHYYKISKNIICLEEIRNIEPEFYNLNFYFKNGGYTTIRFSDIDERDIEIERLWERLCYIQNLK